MLAYFVVLNQFSRNIHRGSPLAFAADALALNAAQQLVETGGDATLLPEQRLFAYLPFEHSESLTMQEQSLRLFRALADCKIMRLSIGEPHSGSRFSPIGSWYNL